MTVRLLFKSVFYLFGTFLHELAHYAAALILGKAEGFSIAPRVEGDNFVFGSVRSRARYKVLSSFISAAPVLWWGVVFLIMRHLQVIRMSGPVPRINLVLLWGKVRTFSLADGFFLWLFIQMIWAGRPSMQDIKNFFKGFFSVSGFVLVSAAALLFYLLGQFHYR